MKIRTKTKAAIAPFLPRIISIGTIFAAFSLVGCGDINSSWENKGGGYIKYTIDGEGPYSIELAKNDVEPPYYVNNSHHYFFFRTRLQESDRGDQISLMVNTPQTGKKLRPVARASVNGGYQYVSWMREQYSSEAPLIPDSSTIKFDEIINDSLWTADLDLYFKDCRTGTCSNNKAPLHRQGRLRYWVPASER